MGSFFSSEKLYRWIRKMNPRVVQNYSARTGPGRFTLLLTTVGRKSGLPRVTPLQYERINDVFYIASARGADADWYKNLLACSQVEVQVQERKFHALAEPITDQGRKADFFEYRIRRNRFVGLLMRLEGIPLWYHRADLERFAAQKAVVALHPVEKGDLAG